MVLVGLAGVFAMNRHPSNGTARADNIERPAVTRNEPEIRDQDISFYTRRTLEDTAGAADREILAALLFARSRATGSMRDLAQAESLARKSVALRTERNGQAFELLASVLMARHAFREARAVVARADSLSPDTPSHLRCSAKSNWSSANTRRRQHTSKPYILTVNSSRLVRDWRVGTSSPGMRTLRDRC